MNKLLKASLLCRAPWLYPDFIYYNTEDGKRFQKNCNFVHNVASEVMQKRRKDLVNNRVLVFFKTQKKNVDCSSQSLVLFKTIKYIITQISMRKICKDS